MKILYQDLINLLHEKPSKKLLSEKLFQLGHEHEIHSDIFDMEITPNRGDCLSLIGLSRDLAVFFGNHGTINLFEDKIEPLEINFENLSPKDCPKISFLEIEIEKNTTIYKPYLENYFNTVGGNKTNLFTDISNYISYELGQPTHCFDKEKVLGDIVFNNKICDSTFKTLLGSEIQLKGSNCIFSVGDEIISLAGVMGGASTACSKETKKVLVECAYFNPESIIGKSVKYNLTSDAAHKFERGVDIDNQERTLRRFIKILQDHVKVKTIKFASFLSEETEIISMPKNLSEINQILGTQLNDKEYINYLKGLGFEVDSKITIPLYRSDIKTQNDLAEEIARVIGYNNIKSIPIDFSKIQKNSNKNKKSAIESFLIDNGFTEVINYPFSSNKEEYSITIDNPLDSNRGNFRTSLKDSLIENLLYNERRQKDSIKLFEISDIYTKDSQINQQQKLGLIISGRMGHNPLDFSKKLDSKYLDGILNVNMGFDNLKIIEIPRSSLNTKKKEKIFYVEVLIDDIPSNFFLYPSKNKREINFVSYKPVSDFPSSSRDFSFSITNTESVKNVIEMLDSISDEIIKDSFMFDFYKNDDLNIVKLGYRFIFQSNQKTLSDDEINSKVKQIINPIIELDGVTIPGVINF